jgi:hypothetical protein
MNIGLEGSGDFSSLYTCSFEECFYGIVRKCRPQQKARVLLFLRKYSYIGYVGRPFHVRLGNFISAVP